MKHLSSLVVVMMLFGLKAESQSIKGKLLDLTESRPLAGARLNLRSIRDTTNVRNVVADSMGVFRFTSIPVDSFYITVYFIGYEEYRQIVATSDSLPDQDLGTLFIPKSTTELTGVTVAAKTPPTQQKGDTIQYNASQYKVNPDATVEDLVKKAPGITVGRDGTVTAQGEQVRKVTIDGKDFFGDDASAALRNLPADIVDKIQVFDRLSDQAQFTGVDDGNAQKSLNIVTKAGLKNGQFGRFFAGYGTDDRYQAGGNVSFFKGDRRISFVGLSNNINQQNFGSQDLLGVTSSGSGRGGQQGGGRPGGGGQGNFQIPQQNGISKTNSIGVNYGDKWGKKVDIAGSYFFNNSTLDNNRDANTRNFVKPDSVLVRQENSASHTENFNHRASLRIEYRIDSSNTVIVTPSFSFQRNKARSSSFQTNAYELENGFLSSAENNRYNVNSGFSFNNNILFRHQFAKRGRTISFNFNQSFNDRDGFTYQESYTTNASAKNDSVIQYSDNMTRGRTLSANIIYTEPVGKGQLQLNYNPSVTKNKADKETYSYDRAGGTGYTVFNPSQSNDLDNDYNTQSTGLTYRIGDRDKQFAVGMNYQYSTLESDQQLPFVSKISRNFSNFLPNLQWRTKISPRSSIRVFYRSGVNAPSVNQLQDVLDISNPLSVSRGNTDLKQQYTHTLNARYTFTNTQLGQSLFANVFLQKTNDYVTNAIYTAFNDSILTPEFTLTRGGQLYQPVNLDGYYNLRSMVAFGQPVAFIKSNVNLNAEFRYSRTPGFSNNVSTITNVYYYSGGVGVASNISEYIDFNLAYNVGYSRSNNTLQPDRVITSVLRVAALQFNLLSKKGWFLQNDLSNQVNSGLSDGFNQNFWLWNMGAGKKFLANRRAELKLSVFDLLGENQSITRTLENTEIRDERNTVLQRYFMLTFTYNLKNFGTAKSATPGRERNTNFPQGGRRF
ncbi:MAG: TonB-dependent receptor [Chitinophagaceae bacterium]|nr:MAG: TonB-dependent receptor [Chitinophagaceae bacterium]